MRVYADDWSPMFAPFTDIKLCVVGKLLMPAAETYSAAGMSSLPTV